MVEATSDKSQSFKHLTFNPILTYNRVTGNETNEHDGIASNGKMVAMAWNAMSTVAVFGTEKTRTFDATIPLLKGHTGTIYDMAWSPFEDRLLSTCADDGKVKLWVFDDYEGCYSRDNNSEPDMDIEAHPRKTLSVQWHAAAENVLATHSIDKTIKLWDINEDRADDPIITFTDMPDTCTSLRWSPSGSMIGAMVKNKSQLYVDPRQPDSCIKAAAHAGPRQQRMAWVDDQTILTAGFDSSAQRQWGAWDLRNMEQPLLLGPLNEGSGVPYFHFDREFNIMLLHARGDNTIPIYHFDKSSPTMLNILATQNFLQTTQKGFCMMPKHVVDVSKQEIMRACRVTNNTKLDILALRIPSKVGGFNQEYYPAFVANEPSSNAEAFFAGNDVPPKTMQLSAQKKK